MTNKELLDEISSEMKRLHDEREKNLKDINNSNFSDEMKKQKRQQIFDNFYVKMEEFKERPGYDDAIKSARNEGVMKRKMREAEKKYKDAQITHRGNVSKNSEIPQKLEHIRKMRRNSVRCSSDDIKMKIIDVVNKFQNGAREEPDGSILVEFELGGQTYKILDVNLAAHSDFEYLGEHFSNTEKGIYKVKLGGMKGDVNNWGNQKLKEYVEKQKNDRQMKIPTIEFRRDLINKLGHYAGLTEESDKKLMLTYLTGLYGHGSVCCTMGDDKKSNHGLNSRSILECGRDFYDEGYNNLGFDCYEEDFDCVCLCLISCN